MKHCIRLEASVRRLIWVCTICLCPIKRTLGLYGLMPFLVLQSFRFYCVLAVLSCSISVLNLFLTVPLVCLLSVIVWSYSLAVLSEHSSKSILCIWEHLLCSHVRYMNVVLIDAKAGNIFSGCFRCANRPRRENTCLLGF